MGKNIWLLILVVLIIVIWLIFGGKGCGPDCDVPPVIGGGTDCWTTNQGTQQTLPTLDEGFFGTGSLEVAGEVVQLIGLPLEDAAEIENCGCPDQVDVEVQWQDRHGNTVDADSRHAVSNSVVLKTPVDTCVRRLAELKFDNTGVALNVEIELLELSLQSVRPVRVFYEDESFKDFDVFITDTPPQIPGSMSFTADTISGGGCNVAGLASGAIELAALHVNYQIEFREVGGPAIFTETAQLVFDVPTPGTFAMQ